MSVDPNKIAAHIKLGDREWAGLLDEVLQTDTAPPVPIQPTPPTGSVYQDMVASLTNPATISRTTPNLIATSLADFKNKLAGIQNGDWLLARGFDLVGQINCSRGLSAWARITIDPSCKIKGIATPGGSPSPCFYIAKGASYLDWHFDGVDITNPGGEFILNMGASHHLCFDGWAAHDLGADGMDMFPGRGAGFGEVHHVFSRGHVTNAVLHIAWDPHTEKGTGGHCMNVQDDNYFSVHDNVIAIFGQDCGNPERTKGGGSVLECGVNRPDANGSAVPYNNHYYVKGLRMLYKAQSQTGGNGINMWGGAQHDNTFHIIEVEDMMGKAYSASAQRDPLTRVIVERGSAINTQQNPHEKAECSGKTWCDHNGTIFKNVTGT